MKRMLFIISLAFSINSQTQTLKQSDFDTSILFSLDTLSNSGYSIIPIRMLESGHVTIKCKINDVECVLIIDTGASSTVIDTKFGQKLEPNIDTNIHLATGIGGSNEMITSSNNTISFNGLEINNFTIFIINLDHINLALKEYGINEVDGVIGADILVSRKAVIDYNRMELHLK